MRLRRIHHLGNDSLGQHLGNHGLYIDLVLTLLGLPTQPNDEKDNQGRDDDYSDADHDNHDHGGV